MGQEITDWFTGDGVTSTFTLTTAPLNGQVVSVFLNGLLIQIGDYNVVGGQSVHLTATPQLNDRIAVIYWPAGGIPSIPVGPSPAPYGPFPAPVPPGPGIPASGGAALLNLADICNDPDLAQQITILRGPGKFTNGVWATQTSPIPCVGVVSIAADRELEMIPPGDVVHGAIVLHTAQPIFTTQEKAGSSDILVWNNKQYRVLRVARYADYGYWRAIATRLSTGG